MNDYQELLLYKEMYLKLFHETTKVIQSLEEIRRVIHQLMDAHEACEELFLENPKPGYLTPLFPETENHMP